MLDLLLVTTLGLAAAALQDEEDDPRTVKELVRDFRKEEDTEARSMILLLLANHAIEDPKQERAAWQGVAAGLEDEAIAVKREAVRLLALAPDREVAVKGLTEALAAVEEDLKSGGALRRLLRSGNREGSGREGRGGGGREAGGSGTEAKAAGGEEGDAEAGREGGAEKKGKSQESSSEEKSEESSESSSEETRSSDPMSRFRSAAAGSMSYIDELIEAISSLPDDRCVKAMTQFFESTEGRTLSRYRLPAARALGTLGTRAALENVRRALEERARRDAEEAKAKKEEEKGGGRGGRNAGRGGRGGLENLLGALEGLGRETTEESAKSYHEILMTVAKTAELEDMPSFDESAARNWKKWLSSNRSAFPSRLGRIKHLSEVGD